MQKFPCHFVSGNNKANPLPCSFGSSWLYSGWYAGAGSFIVLCVSSCLVCVSWLISHWWCTSYVLTVIALCRYQRSTTAISVGKLFDFHVYCRVEFRILCWSYDLVGMLMRAFPVKMLCSCAHLLRSSGCLAGGAVYEIWIDVWYILQSRGHDAFCTSFCSPVASFEGER